MINIVRISLLMFFVLSGCVSMAPKYTRPEPPVPDKWPTGNAYIDSAVTSDNKSIADIKWQEFFIDEKLQKLIAIALEHNRDLRIAVLNIERSQAQYRIKRANLFPRLAAPDAGWEKGFQQFYLPPVKL